MSSSQSPLPKYILLVILEYLPYDDFISVSNSRSPLGRHLQERFKDLEKPDFDLEGPYHCEPVAWFDVPVEEKGLLFIKMKFEWRDQGWGNRKGLIWLRLLRDGEPIADNRAECGPVAEHGWKEREIIVDNHAVTKEAMRGDVLRVMVYVGGGGGHHLYVKNFNMRLITKKPWRNEKE